MNFLKIAVPSLFLCCVVILTAAWEDSGTIGWRTAAAAVPAGETPGPGGEEDENEQQNIQFYLPLLSNRVPAANASATATPRSTAESTPTPSSSSTAMPPVTRPPSTTGTPTPTPTATSPMPPVAGACLARSVPPDQLVTVSGNFSTDLFTNVPARDYLNNGDTWTSLSSSYVLDFSQARWETEKNFPLYIERGNGTCLAGVTIIGTRDPQQTIRDSWHSMSAFGARTENFLLENVYAENLGDGIRFADAQDEATCHIYNTADNFTVRGVYFKDMRDDCVENDWGRNGLIDDSLFEGCYVGISTRSGNHCSDRLDSVNNVVTIQNSLIYMKPMLVLRTDGSRLMGNSELFKDDSNGPQFALHNNVFRADASLLGDPDDELGYGIRRSSGQPGDPNSKLMSCSNNVFVWLGPGDYPPPYNDDKWRIPLQWLTDPTTGEPCFTFTKDVAVWDQAVADWKARHGY